VDDLAGGLDGSAYQCFARLLLYTARETGKRVLLLPTGQQTRSKASNTLAAFVLCREKRPRYQSADGLSLF
jgi:hypothetical protein